MNTKVLGLVAAVIIVAAGAFFFVSNGDDENNDNTANSDSSQQDGTNSDQLASDNFLNIDTAALSGAYQLQVTSNEGGESLTGTFVLDGQGNVSTIISQGGQESGFIVLDGVTYFQNPEDGSWVFYPEGSQQAPSFDVNDLALNDDDINEISNSSSIEDLGEQACDAGTCRVYRDLDETEDETAIVKIDKSNGRLSEVEVINNTTGEVTNIVYTYPGDISIIAPEGATEFVIPEIPQ